MWGNLDKPDLCSSHINVQQHDVLSVVLLSPVAPVLVSLPKSLSKTVSPRAIACGKWSKVLRLGICLFQRGQSVLDGELDETWEVADAQFVHQASAIRFDGLYREGEGVRNLCTRFALDDEL